MKWQACAPSNIALIKYMGKIDPASNQASNPSLSYTLKKLTSTVELETASSDSDTWQAFANSDLHLTSPAITRFLNHLQTIKKTFNVKQTFTVRSQNNFPADCGLASSASSFAALTLCAVQACSELSQNPYPDQQALSALCRLGSGSACRSLFEPWALWQGDSVKALDLPEFNDLQHAIIVVSQQAKKVSSSNAHQRVLTSALYPGRPERANQRLQDFLQALDSKDWQAAFQCAWQEFWDMHALFETSQVPFGYLQADTLAALNVLRYGWEKRGDGPLVTMDAGPNIHLLFHTGQQQTRQQVIEELSQRFTVL